jgi:hypothetical protein
MTPFQKNWLRLKWRLTPSLVHQKRLAQAIGILRDYPGLSDVLAMAEKDGVKICFNPDMIGTRTTGVFVMRAHDGGMAIRLRPGPPPEQLAMTLVHELRHYWQKKYLGITPENHAGRNKNAQTRLAVTRLMEADAYAFCYVAARMTRDLNNDFAFLEKQKNGNPRLSAAEKDALMARVQRRRERRLRRYPVLMRLRFLQKLKTLDNYDRKALRDYHAHHFKPKKKSRAGADLFEIAHLRCMLRCGFDGNAPDYMAGVSDRALQAALLRPVRPAIRKTARLMTDFEAAARKERHSEAGQQRRQEIRARVRKLKPRK